VTTTILLVRHGHVAGIVPKRFRGRLDIPLSAEGRAQADCAADYIAQRYRPDLVYTSPLQRCRDSAHALTSKLALPDAAAAPGLTDIDYGLWQGRLASEVAATEPELYATWQRSPQELTFPGGESLAGVAERASAALGALAAKHVGKCIAAYSHDSVIRVLLLCAIRAPMDAYHRIEIDPCSLSELRLEPDGTAEIARINERTR
jgi:probable phosphoglycerate mutase